MNYIEKNKEAWEEAFEKRSKSWGKDRIRTLKEETYPYLEEALLNEIRVLDLRHKDIAQFCCNDGRELLSIARQGVRSATGFDIAENTIGYAKATAQQTGIPCEFLATNILDIDSSYNNRFDLIIITIGALIWFEDLTLFFKKVSDCLKPEGLVIIHELHPFTNILGCEGEEGYDPTDPAKLIHPYFFKGPRTSDQGIAYLSDSHYPSKVFTDFVHTFEDIISAMIMNGLNLEKLKEYDVDISELFNPLSHKALPLSTLLIGRKNR